MKPLFVSGDAKSAYLKAYDALLSKYDVPVQDHWVDAQLGRVHIIETGIPEGVPVLLLHAAGCSAAEWYANYGALGRACRVFAMDMPGDAGKSELEKDPERIEDYTTTILQVLNALQLDRPVLIGHSIGGFFAAGFAMAYPERVAMLILLSPVATHVPIRWYLKLLLKWTGRPGTGPHAIKTLKMQAFRGFTPEPLFVELMECVRDYCTVQMLFPYVYPKTDLSRLTMPVHLIVGTEEPLHSWKRSVQLVREKIPLIGITVLDDTGHTPNMERPAETNRLLLELVQRN